MCERETECVCVCEIERERERERWSSADSTALHRRRKPKFLLVIQGCAGTNDKPGATADTKQQQEKEEVPRSCVLYLELLNLVTVDHNQTTLIGVAQPGVDPIKFFFFTKIFFNKLEYDRDFKQGKITFIALLMYQYCTFVFLNLNSVFHLWTQSKLKHQAPWDAIQSN